jgi:vacuolar-type H+-ATPase subunit F/Vma7
MYKIAFIGPKLEALGLKALGIETRECDAPQDAMAILRDLTKGGEFAVIFISSQLASEMPTDEIELLKTKTLSIIPISGSKGSFDLIGDGLSSLTKGAIGKEIKISG